MDRNDKRRVFAVAAILFLWIGINAQSKYEGNYLLPLLGKPAESEDINSLKAGYQFEMANNNHYLSKDGIELMFVSGLLNQIQLYRNSVVYGQFTGKLPQDLKFGMTPAEVRAILGKPTVAYNSTGYLEFIARGNIYACSFEKGQLNELGISIK